MAFPKHFSSCQNILLYLCVFFGPLARCQGNVQFREFSFSVCKGKIQITNVAIHQQKVTSSLECVRECVSHDACLSLNVCNQEQETKQCSLFNGTLPTCTTLATQNECSFIQMSNTCQNGGRLDKTTMTCACLQGWQGALCQTTSTSTLPTTVTSTTAQPTTATTTHTTTVNPNACLTGTICAMRSPKSSMSGVDYCCQIGMYSINAAMANGFVTCSCS